MNWFTSRRILLKGHVAARAPFRVLISGLADAAERRKNTGLDSGDGPRSEENAMADVKDPLVLDLVEWIAREPRLYAEVIESWRTSCPRLTIWEDAVDHGYVAREAMAGGTLVSVTAAGEKFLRDNGRLFPSPLAGEGGSRRLPDEGSLSA
jgi:hypothetical protein